MKIIDGKRVFKFGEKVRLVACVDDFAENQGLKLGKVYTVGRDSDKDISCWKDNNGNLGYWVRVEEFANAYHGNCFLPA